MLVNWLNRTLHKHITRSSSARRSRQRRLGAVETLEDRCLLATFIVSNLLDSGAGSLRQAVTSANNSGIPFDVIQFDASLTGRTIMVGARMIITDSVQINGPSSNADGIILNGGANQRIFQNEGVGTVINNLTITNGAETDGGGFSNFGTATLNNVVISNSSASSSGGGVFNGGTGTLTINNSQIVSNLGGFGGAIVSGSAANLTINRSTISGNVGTQNAGGIQSLGTLTINASTIAVNSAVNVGGGINHQFGALSITNSTIAHNTVSGTGSLGGGGLSVDSGSATLRHVTIANNVSLSTAATSGGGIARSGGTISVTRSILAQNLNPANSANNNTGGSPTVSVSTTTDVRILGPLQDNGGPTLTMMPLTFTNPRATDRSGGITPPTTDQRGYPRIVNGGIFNLPDDGAVEFHPGVPNPYLVSTGPGIQGTVFVFGEDGTLKRSIVPYPGFMGGVRAVLGDVNNDGIKDIITAPGPGGGPNIKAFDGLTGGLLTSFNAYPAGFTGGLFLGTGDFNGDGRDDIVTAPGPGGGPDIRVIDSSNFTTDILRISAYNPLFRGGVQVAVANINGGTPDIVTAPGAGGGPNVRVFSGSTGAMFGNFNAYGSNFTGGVFVGTGDVNGDGQQDIITGPGFTGGPHVRVFSGANVSNPTALANTFPYVNAFTGGVRVSSVDINGDGFDDIITGAGTGGGPHVTIVDGRTLTQNLPGERYLQDQFPLNINFTGGVFVAGSSATSQGGSPLLLIGQGQSPTSSALPQPTTADAEELKSAAIAQFAQAGLDDGRLAQLETASITLTEFDGNLLGWTYGNTVLIDIDAAGLGYFVDARPADDLEFQTASSAPLNRVDLLAAIAHELSHVLGLEREGHSGNSPGLLSDHVPLGAHRRVTHEDLEALDTLYTGESLLEV